jgi:metal-responsive CopG/Arc/MetJ family transcriptional regulator
MTTVNLSFQEDLLAQIDRVAQAESRSRSELIREAARFYIDRKNRWDAVFAMGQEAAAAAQLKPEDVQSEIDKVRQARKSR